MGGEGDRAQALPPAPGTLVPLQLGAPDCPLTGVSRDHEPSTLTLPSDPGAA